MAEEEKERNKERRIKIKKIMKEKANTMERELKWKI